MDLEETTEALDSDPDVPVTFDAEEAASRLATVWGLHATASGLVALFEQGLGPRGAWLSLADGDEKPHWRVDPPALDRWAAYHAPKNRERYLLFKKHPNVEVEVRKPRFLIVGLSWFKQVAANALAASGWRVLWANTQDDALELAAAHRLDAAMFDVRQGEMELATILLEALAERGVACFLPELDDNKKTIPAWFVERAKLFGSNASFVDAVNSLPVAGSAPLQLQLLEEPGDELERRPLKDLLNQNG